MSFNAKSTLLKTTAAAAALLAGTAHVQAMEGNSSSWPMGIENFNMGLVPPPGFYGQVFAMHYNADTLRDDDGHDSGLDFDLRMSAIMPRFIWITEQKVLGGNLGFHVLVPLLDGRLKVNGQRETESGVGDVHLGPLISHHYSDKLHTAFGFDLVLPTGEFDRDENLNLGRNHETLQLIYALTYLDPKGLQADVRFMYEFNAENDDTDYTSGQEFHFDYAVGWGFGNGWTAGVGGYAYWQVTNDDNDGRFYGGQEFEKGRAFGIGPSVQYASPNGWFLSAKWQDDVEVRNRPDGNSYWLKWTFPI